MDRPEHRQCPPNNDGRAPGLSLSTNAGGQTWLDVAKPRETGHPAERDRGLCTREERISDPVVGQTERA